MNLRGHLGMVLAASVWMALPCAAQSTPEANPAPCTVAPQPDPCGTTPATPNKSSTMQKFPFPGEAGSIGPSPAPGSGAPSLSGVPQAPDASSAKKDFPFPGDAGGGANAGSSSSGSGTSSSSSSSSAGDDTTPADPSASPALTDQGSEGSTATPGRHILHRVNPVGTKLQSTDEREQEDLDVANFYVQSGNLQGAYLRSQDAVKTSPDDPDAHFALAEIARKLNKRDEAIAEYTACLKLDPIEKKAKEARKALEQLKP